MKTIIKNTLIGVLIFGLSGCSGFLDEFPDSGIAQEEAVQSMADMEKALVAVYAMTKSGRLFSGSMTLLPEIQCDGMYAIIGNGNLMGEFYQWNFTAQQQNLSSIWAGWWALLSTSNFVIANQGKANPGTEADSIRLRSIVGEAHLARALAYSEMAKTFCDPYGKKLGGEPIDPKNQLGLQIWDDFGVGTPGRSDMYTYYQNILNEIRLAKSGITRKGTDDVYFSKGAVYALETRVHVAMGEWKEAIRSASYVIDSCNYVLLDATKKDGQDISDYENMWINDKGDEIIWKVAFSKDYLGGALGSAFYTSTQGKFRPEYIPARWVLDLYSKEDARYDIFFQEQETAYSHKLKWPLLKKYPGNPVLQKGEASNYVNMPKVFRLSEIYLLRAEAYLESGDEVKAKADIQTLQAKRMKSVKPFTDVRKELRNERTRELYMEGHRLYDLKRWGMGFTRVPQEQTTPPTNALSKPKDDVFFTWPIPSHEMDVPGSQMVGNPSNYR